MPYIPNTDDDRRAMLEAIGAESIDELFEMIPREFRLDRLLDLPAALGELELQDHIRQLADGTAASTACFLGGGSYDHFISRSSTSSPRGASSTSYALLAEASQGRYGAVRIPDDDHAADGDGRINASLTAGRPPRPS